jgi:hypothetical protein
MSKKHKRQTKRTANTPQSAASQTIAVQPSPPAKPINVARPAREEFNPDYSYVIKDLRRIGTLAGTFVAILIVLSFFLR